MDSRLDAHRRLSHLLASADDDTLRDLLRGERTDGWGTHRTVQVGGSAVFAKSVPLTERERAQHGCTANLFGLPTFYSYGVGSGGFGVWRELAMHRKTTAWVLDGAIDTFPLLLHHRVLPIASPHKTKTPAELDRYVTSWDGSEPIREFILARERATHEVVFFLEHVPYVMSRWLGTDPDRLDVLTEGMARTTAFLREQGVVHFDAHFGNILSDGQRIVLTDYGLALDGEFDLAEPERAFLAAHRHFDVGEFITCLYRPLRGMVEGWDEPTRGGFERRFGDVSLPTLLVHADELIAEGALQMPGAFLAALRRYEPVMTQMDAVFAALRSGPKHLAGYDDAELERRLRQVGWPGLEALRA